MTKWSLRQVFIFAAEVVILLFVLTALAILFAGFESGDMSSADMSLVLATLALSIGTFLLARHSEDLSRMDVKRAHRISIEDSTGTAMSILADRTLDSISPSLSKGSFPGPQYQYARQLFANLPLEEKGLKKLAADTLKAMEDAVYGGEAERIVNAGKAQDLYKELRDSMRDAISRWRNEL